MEQKKKLALEIIERLKKEYPDAECSLDYNEAWKLLVSVRLAAQCTDARVNVVVEKLYEKFPDVNALANAEVDEIEEIVRPCGLGRSKARDISACMRILRDEYNGNVPEDFEELLKLPSPGEDSNLKITIGPENLADELKDSSVVVARYDAGQDMQGLIGVVGPTRMNYSKVAARLSYIANGLSWLLSGGELPPKSDPDDRD